MLTAEHALDFDRDGFVVVENLFTPEEVRIVLDHIEAGRRSESEYTFQDKDGRASKLAIWSDIGNDVFGAVSANPRVVNGAVALLREDVFHWHTKVMLKEPKSGGAWEWHQDYGYWYLDGCLYPRMLSVMIALDRATKENGCLKVLVGSHHLGRLDHGFAGQQRGIDEERIKAVQDRFPVRYLEAEPGSAIFFHCNTLHSSEPNLSDHPRRALICAYNVQSNLPVGVSERPEPIRRVEENAVMSFAGASAG